MMELRKVLQASYESPKLCPACDAAQSARLIEQQDPFPLATRQAAGRRYFI
jgi:hypothetical protein